MDPPRRPNRYPPPSISAVTYAAANPTHTPAPTFSHPPYAEMIYAAIAALRERDGSSRRAIAKYIEQVYPRLVDSPSHSALLTHHLKRLKSSGHLEMVKKSYKIPGPPRYDLPPPPAQPRGRRRGPPRSDPALSMLPGEEEREAVAQKEEEERQIAMAIMVSLEPELQQGSIPPLSFWQIEPTADASGSSTPLQPDQARVSQALTSAQQAQPESSSSRPECEICYDAPIGATCDPCGHVACFNCWVNIQAFDNKCPRCRVVIKKIIKLFL